jgi:hypothetical protein
VEKTNLVELGKSLEQWPGEKRFPSDIEALEAVLKVSQEPIFSAEDGSWQYR